MSPDEAMAEAQAASLAFQAALARMGVETLVEAISLFRRLRPEDVTGTAAGWLDDAITMVLTRRRQSQEQYNTCISKGATFVQCTTTAITPVGVESWVPPEDAPPVYLGDTPLRGIMLGETKVIGAYLGETPLWGGDFSV